MEKKLVPTGVKLDTADKVLMEDLKAIFPLIAALDRMVAFYKMCIADMIVSKYGLDKAGCYEISPEGEILNVVVKDTTANCPPPGVMFH